MTRVCKVLAVKYQHPTVAFWRRGLLQMRPQTVEAKILVVTEVRALAAVVVGIRDLVVAAVAETKALMAAVRTRALVVAGARAQMAMAVVVETRVLLAVAETRAQVAKAKRQGL
jgi:hypothetical protein